MKVKNLMAVILDNKSTLRNVNSATSEAEATDEFSDNLQKHKMIEAAHHVADIMLGPVGGVLVAHALHAADMAAELYNQPNTNNANAIPLNQPHLTLNGVPTAKPVLVLDANDDPRNPGKKLNKKPSEKVLSETEKRYHERAFSQAMDLTPAIHLPSDRPGMPTATARKRKRITPI
ncbi:hypothetical protein [Undibacterium sp. YM2]|uniref:hypothetical protein n=1 Tax=Undibacterium sp. YM2 TaxID=2058625 RepID=UPI001389F1A2|nr:hypothetical protein [Undibacterium sp. YM2]